MLTTREAETVVMLRRLARPIWSSLRSTGRLKLSEVPVTRQHLARPNEIHPRRLQRSARASLVVGDKRIPFLVSCFDTKVGLFDDLEIGASYNFRGYLRRKIGRVNGEKVLSFYLNLP